MSRVDAEAVEAWRLAIGREMRKRQVLEIEPLRRFALAIGSDPDVERARPALGHWAFFTPDVPDEKMDLDGHPLRGDFLPVIPLNRRMFAASEVTFEAPLSLGGAAELVTTVADVTCKHGRTGTLAFVILDRALSQDSAVCVRERQTIVYRERGGPLPLPEPADANIEGVAWTPGPASLFRFSAATFNAHRVHYDLPYARDDEGYPERLVHGPFTAARLAEMAQAAAPLAEFSFRAMQPLFSGQAIRLQRAANQFRAVRCDGEIAMTAEARWR